MRSSGPAKACVLSCTGVYPPHGSRPAEAPSCFWAGSFGSPLAWPKGLGIPQRRIPNGASAAQGRFGASSSRGQPSGTRSSDKAPRRSAVRIVGDLMVDAARVPQDPGGRARVAEPLGFDPARPVVAVFPGSRPHELRVTLPLFLDRGPQAGPSSTRATTRRFGVSLHYEGDFWAGIE